MPWYKKKIFYVPIAIFLGIFGFLASLVSLFGVPLDSEFNPDYYTSKDEPLWKKPED